MIMRFMNAWMATKGAHCGVCVCMCCNIMFCLSSYIVEDNDDDWLPSMRISLYTVTISTFLLFLMPLISLALALTIVYDRPFLDIYIISSSCLSLNSVYGVVYVVFLIWDSTGVRSRSMFRVNECMPVGVVSNDACQIEDGKERPIDNGDVEMMWWQNETTKRNEK